jgi:hypothetical protein
MHDDILLRRQAALHAEGEEVLAQLNLMQVLSKIGRPEIVGSFALGLMVWRDIDVEVYCDEVSAARVFDAIRPIIDVPGVYRLTFHDFSGPRADPSVPDGYYWGVRYHRPGEEEWKLDIWLISAGTMHRMGRELVRTLPAQLTSETRMAILQLKTTWYALPTYRREVLSVDVYDAVLNHGVRTPDEFDTYLRLRGKPTR